MTLPIFQSHITWYDAMDDSTSTCADDDDDDDDGDGDDRHRRDGETARR
jgi:hypothetical protein